MARRLVHLRRRPQDSVEDFSKRTAKLIHDCFIRCAAGMVYIRVLCAVYKFAWKAAHFVLDCGDSPLATCRAWRNTLWWQTHVTLFSSRKRRKLGTLHGGPGMQRAAWEYPFVCVWGVHWEERMHNCADLGNWLRGMDDFVQQICQQWGLPLGCHDNIGHARIDCLQSVKLPTSLEDIRPILNCGKEHLWDESERRLWIQVDKTI